MNKKIVWVLVSGLMALSLVIAACGPTVERETTVTTGELAKHYASADELWADSDLVVIGVFEDQERIVEPNTPRNGDSQPPFHPGWRELAFRVTETIKGHSEGLIWVAQHVVFKADGVGPTEEDTLFEPGQRYVLFLRPSVQQPGEFFWLTGATQGAFRINVNDRVYSRNVVGEIPERVGPTVDGVPLDQFIRSLKD